MSDRPEDPWPDDDDAEIGPPPPGLGPDDGVEEDTDPAPEPEPEHPTTDQRPDAEPEPEPDPEPEPVTRRLPPEARDHDEITGTERGTARERVVERVVEAPVRRRAVVIEDVPPGLRVPRVERGGPVPPWAWALLAGSVVLLVSLVVLALAQPDEVETDIDVVVDEVTSTPTSEVETASPFEDGATLAPIVPDEGEESPIASEDQEVEEPTSTAPEPTVSPRATVLPGPEETETEEASEPPVADVDDAGSVTVDAGPLLPVPAGGLEGFQGQLAIAERIAVQEIVDDDGFWIGSSPRERLFVRAEGAAAQLFEGDIVSFTAAVSPAPTDGTAAFGLSQRGARQLDGQGGYLDVGDNTIEVFG